MQKTTEKMIPEDYEFNLSDFALFMSVMKIKEAYEDVKQTLALMKDVPAAPDSADDTGSFIPPYSSLP